MTASKVSMVITMSAMIKWYARAAAGVCSFLMPDNKSLQVQRALLVDDHLSVSSILYVWDFDTFLLGYRVQFHGANSACFDSRTTRYGLDAVFSSDVMENLVISLAGANAISPSVFKTPVDGIGIKNLAKDVVYPVGGGNG